MTTATHTPRALINARRNICIEVARTHGSVLFIAMEASGLIVAREKVRLFDEEWTRELTRELTPDYTPTLAAARFLRYAAERSGAEADARAYLEAIAATGHSLEQAPPHVEAPRELPLALKAHQFKAAVAPSAFTVTLAKGGGPTKLNPQGARAALVAYLAARKGRSATLAELDDHFKSPQRAVVGKLEAVGWVVTKK